MIEHKAQVAQLLATEWFRDFVRRDVVPHAPQVPAYAPGRTEADWIYGSALRAGYLLAYKHLGVDLDDV